MTAPSTDLDELLRRAEALDRQSQEFRQAGKAMFAAEAAAAACRYRSRRMYAILEARALEQTSDAERQHATARLAIPQETKP
jgi:hypothetical protein